MPGAPPRPERFVLVRHGETEWSASGRHTGRTDIELTPDGRIMAMALNAMLIDILGIDEPAVFTSPLRRAATTAALALPGVDRVPCDLIVEYDYGEYEGMTTPEIDSVRPGWNLFVDGCPGGETLLDVCSRARSFVELAMSSAAPTVVVFTHGHFSRILTTVLLGMAPQTARRLLNDTASISVVMERRGERVLTSWNLRPAGAASRLP
jgi:probable phosphoglycerate mutase